MLITDKVIYIELHKTACSHTRKILSRIFKDNYKIVGKHNRYDQVPKDMIGDFEGKLKVGNIRNPWDWYVSLWSFGCGKEGGLYQRLVYADRIFFNDSQAVKQQDGGRSGLDYPISDPALWKRLYSDPYNIENFNHWLRLILSSEKYSTGEEYKTNRMSEFAGFLTYRYLRLYTYRRQFNNIDSEVRLEEYDVEENFMDFIIRTENLNDDLMQLASKLGYNMETVNNILDESKERSNSSNRNRDYRPYYSDQSISLVSKYESYIIKKYDYSFG